MLNANGPYLQAPHKDPRSSAREHIVLLSGGEHCRLGFFFFLLARARDARVKIGTQTSRCARCPEKPGRAGNLQFAIIVFTP